MAYKWGGPILTTYPSIHRSWEPILQAVWFLNLQLEQGVKKKMKIYVGLELPAPECQTLKP